MPEEEQLQQPLIEHLLELRQRVLRSLLVILAVFLSLFAFSKDIYALLAAPLLAVLPEGTTMIATEVASPFLTPFKLTVWASIFISIPYLLHQIWAFVSPGLYQHEKKIAFPMFVSSVILFYAGMAFAYFVVFPLVFEFFTSVAPEGVAVMTDINHYLSFVIKLFFAFGLAFEIPIATVLLIMSGATTVESLKEKRAYVFIGCFVVGMLLTPPDVISQTLLALPMWFLFEIGIIMGSMVQPRDNEAPQTAEEKE